MSAGGRLWPWQRDPTGWARRCLAGAVGLFVQERGLERLHPAQLRGAWSGLTEHQRQHFLARTDGTLRASYQETGPS